MSWFWTRVLPTLLIGVSVAAAAVRAAETGAPAKQAAEKEVPAKAAEKANECLACHGNSDVWEGQQRRLYVTAQDLAADAHWQKGLRCADCHGGDPATDKFNEAHAEQDGFRGLRTPANDTQGKDYAKPPEPAKVVKLCGDCHVKIDFMRRYNPSPRVDQLREYWTSGHGQRLKASGDPKVATCISCHDLPHGDGLDRAKHGIRLVADLQSPVYRTHVAETCAKCHADATLIAGRQYRGRDLGHDQYAQWQKSVHAEALFKKGDLSAPACNNCHGNHGALPPEVGSVANACGSCHGRVAGLFADTRMKHRFETPEFEKLGLPGCAACHGKHEILMPADEMLGMKEGAFCANCHANGKYGATIAGADTARALRNRLEDLKQAIDAANQTVADAERLGMLLRSLPSDAPNTKIDPRIYMRRAFDSLTNARVLIHGFKLPVEASGLSI
jgi:predicted CXXCH cytochrome family protein